ncbi:hypothetical protein FSP39_025154 [Pinctada imbricata]|uniref:Reverse transcriptase n=1 Tax=Pinctada imbricata TaxID=66713 RepID=A0AA89C526_PINIB|nr:hypothetical protein FSP39_025154 [Pinctada imbricata]
MADLDELISKGKSLGYEGDDLRSFVKDQQDRLRDERAAKREQDKLQVQLRLDQEKFDRDLKMKQMEHQHEIAILEKRGELKGQIGTSDTGVRPKSPKIPPFDDARDDMDSYLRRFERYAQAQKWELDTWATNLSALLKGRALDVYALLPADQALRYDAVKEALLKRFDKTEEGFKRRFRSCRPELGETFAQFSVRLSGYLQRWLEMAKTKRTFDDLFDLVMRDQFIHICNHDLALFLKERTPKSVCEMALLADQFREARRVGAFALTSKVTAHKASISVQGQKASVPIKPKSEQTSHPQNVNSKTKGFIPKSDRRCYKCNKVGHIASECLAKSNDRKGKVGAVVDEGHDDNVPDVECMNDSLNVCGAFMTPSDSIRNSESVIDNSVTLTQSCQTVSACLPVSNGYVEGNVDGVRRPGDPDPEWGHVHAVETRNQKRVRESKPMKMKVPEIIKNDISPSDFRQAQEDDQTLSRARTSADEEQVFQTKTGKVKWCRKNGLVHREYTDKNGNVSLQVLVPVSLRDSVMRLAHESIMSGHLGTMRTVSRVLSEFYWPGVQSDVKRFCQSCDICQRTVSKGRVTKVPLQQMPLIDEPFQRVAVDLIGPLHPITDRGNRYILTLVDFATRYPEAVALSTIDTERVAEALVEIFSRVGVPREMLTDMGSQFTSALMKEVSRLISMKQLTTTPYHPMCNGLVERFNGTLKQMLKRMCAERPRDWDKHLNPALFAYREVPQESLGFSPFELVYGRAVRGPMTILKELWTKEIKDPSVKSTYQYVIDLRERIESTCNLAKENLSQASKMHRVLYNRKARDRRLEVGNKVLVLLPTDNNKLLLQWKGPYNVVKKMNAVDYQVDLGGRSKTCHANMLKKYVERADIHSVLPIETDAIKLVCSTVVDESLSDQGEIIDLPNVSQKEGPSDVDINQDLSLEQQREASNLLHSFADIFTDLPGHTNILKHEIRLNVQTPIRPKARIIPYAMIETVSAEVDKMIDLNVIEPSDSSYASPIVIVKKKDGTNRFCIDFRALNSQTKFDAEPMPDADEIFSKLASHKYFSSLDLTKGYWQVPLSDDSKPLTAFQTPKGLFQFRVMPFGLVTASATFTRLMRVLMQGLENVDNFIDDIIVFTSTFHDHLEVLRKLFLRLRNANLKVRPSKCALLYPKVECLGHVVGNDQISPNPDKVSVIEKAQIPTTKKQLRSFLGLVGFYRKYVPNFAVIALPLTDMTKKGKPNRLEWSESAEHAFQSLKQALVKFPILKLPDMGQMFILQTDASNRGIGAVLLQNSGNEKLPVAYAGRKLKKSEQNYATIEKECLAIIWAVLKFQRYLYGAEFLLETDHKPLIYLHQAKVNNARLMRWALSLQPYRFRLMSIKGKENVGADYLSRI